MAETESLPAIKPLTAVEQRELAEYEKVIEQNFLGFVAVGAALMEIRDKRLYRTPDDPKRTFADYCRERWDMTRARACQLTDAAEVTERLEMSTIVDILPSSESQVRPLLTFSSPDPTDSRKRVIDHDEVANVWAEVVERAPRNGNDEPVITAKHVKATVDQWKTADESYREEPVFDFSAASADVTDKIRRLFAGWPAEAKDFIPSLLRGLAKEDVNTW